MNVKQWAIIQVETIPHGALYEQDLFFLQEFETEASARKKLDKILRDANKQRKKTIRRKRSELVKNEFHLGKLCNQNGNAWTILADKLCETERLKWELIYVNQIPAKVDRKKKYAIVCSQKLVHFGVLEEKSTWHFHNSFHTRADALMAMSILDIKDLKKYKHKIRKSKNVQIRSYYLAKMRKKCPLIWEHISENIVETFQKYWNFVGDNEATQVIIPCKYPKYLPEEFEQGIASSAGIASSTYDINQASEMSKVGETVYIGKIF